MTHHREVFDRMKLRRLQRAYGTAVREGRESFTFDGVEYLTSYARYLIEYLKQELQ